MLTCAVLRLRLWFCFYDLQRILAVKYSIPPALKISPECQDLLSRIFVANPAERITLTQIKQHPWFLKNLPIELAVSAHRVIQLLGSVSLRSSCCMLEQQLQVIMVASA